MASPDVLLLQETKILEEIILSLSKTKGKKNIGKVVSERGSYGGLETLWREEMFSIENSFET